MTINTTTPGTEADIDLDKLRSDFEAWFHKYSPRTNLSRVNGIYEAENLNHLWRNFCAEAGVGLPGARRAAPPTAELPAILFDGKAVLDEVKAHATNALRTGPENVVDVLDAVVRLMRRAAPLAHPIGQGSVTLTGNQLRAALDFINPDGPGDEDQCNDELTFGIRQHRDDEGKVDTGMCCWNNDMDGEVFPLPDEYATPSSTDSAQAAVEEVRLLAYDPNIRWARQRVRLTLKQWDYATTLETTVCGNCQGFEIFDSAISNAWEALPTRGADIAYVALARADGDTLECADDEMRGDDWLKEMVVGIEIVGQEPERTHAAAQAAT